jgi:hypothetical protein
MEALIAVGLAGNVVQFIQFSGALIAETRSIHAIGSPRSLPGTLDRTKELTRQAEMISDRLRATNSATTVRPEDQVSRRRFQMQHYG